MTLFAVAVAWESQCDSRFIEEEVKAQRPETDDPVGRGKVESGAQVPATHLGQTAGQAVLEVKAIVCWGQHLDCTA